MEKNKVFIASSSEMEYERKELVYLMVIDMNEELESKGYELIPEKWEYMDSSMRGRRKEDEYLDNLRECEICLSLFWNTIGQYTIEELNVALNEQQCGHFPRLVHVFFKESTDIISENLLEFKKEFISKHSSIVVTFSDISELRQQVKELIYNYISRK